MVTCTICGFLLAEDRGVLGSFNGLHHRLFTLETAMQILYLRPLRIGAVLAVGLISRNGVTEARRTQTFSLKR